MGFLGNIAAQFTDSNSLLSPAKRWLALILPVVVIVSLIIVWQTPAQPYTELFSGREFTSAELVQIVDGKIANINPRPERMITIAGLVVGFRTYNTRRGDTMAFISLDDQTARADVSVFGDLYSSTRKMVQSESLLVVTGTCSTDERTGELQIRADQIDTIESVRSRALTKITVSLNQDVQPDSVLTSLSDLLRGIGGNHTDLEIQYFNARGDAISMNLGTEWRFDVSDKLIEELNRLFGVPNVHLIYDPSRLQNAIQAEQVRARQYPGQQVAQFALGEGPLEGFLDMFAGMIDQMHVVNPGGASRHARQAGQASVDMAYHTGSRGLAAFQLGHHLLERVLRRVLHAGIQRAVPLPRHPRLEGREVVEGEQRRLIDRGCHRPFTPAERLGEECVDAVVGHASVSPIFD